MSIATPTIEPAAQADHDYLWTLNFGPQHPATHTTLRIVLKLDGERVIDAVPDIGYLHSGFEKMGEHLDYNQYVTVTDRISYISPMANNVAWRGSREAAGIEITPRCKVHPRARRQIGPHQRPSAFDRGDWARCGGVHVFPLRLLSAGSHLRHLRDAVRGAFTNSYTRVGNVMYDITRRSSEDPHVREEVSRDARNMERLLNTTDLRRYRTKINILTKAGHERRAPGPIARSSGVTRDLRMDEPYLSYADFDFDVCCSTAGDCFARYYVHMAEMRESLKIITQAVEHSGRAGERGSL
jgi:NADH-quinone oxidoreductase subunit D